MTWRSTAHIPKTAEAPASRLHADDEMRAADEAVRNSTLRLSLKTGQRLPTTGGFIRGR